MITPRYAGSLAVVNDNIVLYIGGSNIQSIHQCVDVLELSSELPRWKPTVDMLVKRKHLGVGVINNHVYAVSNVEL